MERGPGGLGLGGRNSRLSAARERSDRPERSDGAADSLPTRGTSRGRATHLFSTDNDGIPKNENDTDNPKKRDIGIIIGMKRGKPSFASSYSISKKTSSPWLIAE